MNPVSVVRRWLTARALAAGHYTSTACIDAERLDRPELHARCRSTCKHCGARCSCPCGHHGPPAPTYDSLRTGLVEAQEGLWSDLDHAVRHARVDPPVVPGHWSVDCDGLAGRIIEVARLVGPTSWEAVQVELLLTGIYEKVLHAAGVAFEEPDWPAVRDLYARNHRSTGQVWNGEPVSLLDVYPGWRPR